MKEFEIAFPVGHAPAEAELRQAAGRALAGLLRPGDNVLLKASHGVALEKVFPAYRAAR